ncbi:alanyl-tRNA editing protein [Crenobacter sp. SG2305]|uniref:alanyl-tRNA editing protein n=1 Tax=Crenobacter oryzisoli TaxID=3056844 RepID=UPI0025AB0A9A|nr:alanyl-tRNA editing protein [Crenobacter sp. SG2305]MDN0085587.1 alanyl-tRNA editing protein [Crenobacter sp. SG2305]
MTERLYFSSDDTEAIACVTRCAEENGQWFAILDRTLFHPQGGGQPGDSGWIGASRVLKTLQDGDEIRHQIDAPVATGSATIRIDADRRQLHTRLHSAGHLIGYLGQTMGHRPVQAHHRPGESKVTFLLEPGAAPFDAGWLEAALAELVAADLPRVVTLSDAMRTIGFGQLPAFPCGGTHVARLSAIGTVRIGAVREKKGLLTVSYDVGD